MKNLIPYVAAVSVAFPAASQENSQAERLFDLLEQPAFIEILVQEGQAMAFDIAAENFSTAYLDAWDAKVDALMDADTIEASMFAQFEAALDGVDVDSYVTYFESGYGAETIAAEIAARSIMSDPILSSQAIEKAHMQMPMGRFEQIDTFLNVSGYIEQSVAFALTDQYNFSRGLLDGGVIQGMTESDLAAMVWDQEEFITDATNEWFQGYLYLVFENLSDDAIEELISFTASEQGRTLNQILLAAQGDLFSMINYELGREAAKFMIQTDL